MTLETFGIVLALFGISLLFVLVVVFGFVLGFITAGSAIRDEVRKKFETGEFVLASEEKQ
jgi:hypothetical protein